MASARSLFDATYAVANGVTQFAGRVRKHHAGPLWSDLAPAAVVREGAGTAYEQIEIGSTAAGTGTIKVELDVYVPVTDPSDWDAGWETPIDALEAALTAPSALLGAGRTDMPRIVRSDPRAAQEGDYHYRAVTYTITGRQH